MSEHFSKKHLITSIFLMVGIVAGIAWWKDIQSIDISGGKGFQANINARPSMHPGLKSVIVELKNDNESFSEVLFRLHRVSLGKIGETTYSWDWESPVRSLAAMSWVDQSLLIRQRGIVTAWDVHMGAPGVVRFKVWRDMDDSWKVVAQSDLVSANRGYNHFLLASPLPVQAGDYLGFYTDKGGIAINSESQMSSSSLIRQPDTDYYVSTWRNLAYVFPGDITHAVKSWSSRGPYPGFALRVEFSSAPVFGSAPVPGDTSFTAKVLPGSAAYRFELPAMDYAIDEHVAISIEAKSAEKVFISPGLVNIMRGGDKFVGPDYESGGSDLSANVSLSGSSWPAVDIIYFAAAIAGLWSMSRIRLMYSSLVCIFVTLVACGVIWYATSITSGSLSRLLPGLFAFGLMPGYLLLELGFRKLARTIDSAERLLLLFGFSVGLWTITGLFAYRMQWATDNLIYVVLSIEAAGLVILFALRRQFDSGPILIESDLPSQRMIKWLFLLIVAVISIVVGFNTQYQRSDFDTFYHLAGMRKIADGMRIIGGDMLLGPGGGTFPHYASNPWYLLGGLISRVSHVNVAWVYVLLAGGLTALFLMVSRVMLKYLVKDTRIAVMGVLLCIIPWIYDWAVQYRALNSFYLQFIPYPYIVSQLILFPLLTIFCIRALLRGGRESWAAIVILSAAAMGQHLCFVIYVPVLVGIILGTGLLWPDLRTERKSIIISLLAVGAATLVVGYLTASFPLAGKLKPATVQESVEFWRSTGASLWQLSERYFAYTPLLILQDGWKDVLGLSFFAFFSWVLVKRRPHWVQLKGSMGALLGYGVSTKTLFAAAAVILGTWFIIFNPLLIPLVVRFLHSTVPVTRWPSVNTVLSHVLQYGAIAYAAVLVLDRIPVIRPRRLFGFMLFALMFVIVGSKPPTRELVESLDNRGWYPSMLDLPNETLYRGLNHLPPGVVAVRPEDVEFVAAFTPHVAVGARDFRMGDYRSIKERIADNSLIISFDPPTSPAEMKRLLKKYDCRYIVIPVGEPQIVRFSKEIGLFRQLFRTEAHVVFEVTTLI